MSEYMNKDLFEQDVRGFLFFTEPTLAGTERSKMIFEFNKETLYKLREGDIVAVESFTTLTPHKGGTCYALLEILRLSPTHITIDRLKRYKFMGAVREFLKESTKDFEENDPRIIRDHVYIEADAEPTGYMMIGGKNEKDESFFEFEQEPCKPIHGRDIGVLKPDVLKKLINKDIEDGIVIGDLFSNFAEKKIPVLIKPDKMITHHYSVFGFTGSGKSNLNSVMITRLLDSQQLKVVVFDLSDEYTSLMIDRLLSKGLVLIDRNDVPESVTHYLEAKSKNTAKTEQLETAAKELAETSKKPGVYDSETFVHVYQKLFKELLENDKIRIVGHVPSEAAIGIFTVQDFFDELEERATSWDGRHIKNMKDFFPTVCTENGVAYQDNLTEWEIDSIPDFCGLIRALKTKAGIRDTVAFSPTIEAILAAIERSTSKDAEETEETAESAEETGESHLVDLDWVIQEFVEESEDEPNLCIIVSSEKSNLIGAINYVINRSLEIRRRGTKKHNVLFVVDEGHEFVINPREAGTSAEEKESSRIIERLTRMGRKYGLGICIASQRVAHLNTTAISNCHTTFIGSLPRSYDRNTMNEAYAVSQDILNQVVTFPPGNWYVVSMVATGIKNVPIRIVAPNREVELAEFFNDKKHLSKENAEVLRGCGYLTTKD